MYAAFSSVVLLGIEDGSGGAAPGSVGVRKMVSSSLLMVVYSVQLMATPKKPRSPVTTGIAMRFLSSFCWNASTVS